MAAQSKIFVFRCIRINPYIHRENNEFEKNLKGNGRVPSGGAIPEFAWKD
jgi:hypothetical protein